MVETILIFAVLSAIFEAVLLLKLPLRTRLRLLGGAGLVTCLHFAVVGANLWIHWGTIVGSMTAIVAGLMSFITVPIVRWYGGCIRRRVYIPGVKIYALEEVR